MPCSVPSKWVAFLGILSSISSVAKSEAMKACCELDMMTAEWLLSSRSLPPEISGRLLKSLQNSLLVKRVAFLPPEMTSVEMKQKLRRSESSWQSAIQSVECVLYSRK